MRTFVILLCTLLLLSAAPLIAQTADGLPPSVEDTCDKVPECAFGLCNSYCEASDCHCHYGPPPPEGCEPRASLNSCLVREELYFRATGKEPPCKVAMQCPCLDDDKWPSKRATWFEFVTGGILATNCAEVNGELALSVILTDGFWAASVDRLPGAAGGGEGYSCRIREPGLGPGGDILLLNVDQAEACYNLMSAAAEVVCAEGGI